MTGPDLKPCLREVAYDDWPNLLTEQSFSAIERASVQSALLRPLGAPISARKSAAGEKAPELQPAEAGEQHPRGEERDRLQMYAELGTLVRRLLAPTELEEQTSSGDPELATLVRRLLARPNPASPGDPAPGRRPAAAGDKPCTPGRSPPRGEIRPGPDLRPGLYPEVAVRRSGHLVYLAKVQAFFSITTKRRSGVFLDPPGLISP